MPFQEGDRVRLVGVSSKSGMEGTIIKRTSEGKWKVRLADGSGNALLKSGNLQAISEDEVVPMLSKKAIFLPKKEGVAQRAAELAALKETQATKLAAMSETHGVLYRVEQAQRAAETRFADSAFSIQQW